MPEELTLHQEDIEKAQALARDIGIPPQPDIALKILHETNKEIADLKKIADLVAMDVSISARVLKIANSPFFSKGAVNSIFHALQIIGIRNFYNIVLLCSLEDIVQKSGLSLKRFWDHTRQAALISGYLARKLRVMAEEHAYMGGLFHDTGIILLMKRFSDYAEILGYAIDITSLRPISEKFDLITGYENDRYNTNHCIMGYIMAKSWKIPRVLCDAILHHHSSISIHKDPAVKKLCALLHLSELIEMSLTYPPEEFARLYKIWIETYSTSLKELSLSEDQINPLIAGYLELCTNSEN